MWPIALLLDSNMSAFILAKVYSADVELNRRRQVTT